MKKEENENMENLAYKTKKYTYEDLLKINDGNRYEITEDIRVNKLNDCTISLKKLMEEHV